MPTYLIERDIPGVGNMSADDLHGIASKSNDVLRSMTAQGKDVQWIQSFVTGDKIYCLYDAADADTVREHATLGGFPADSVEEVKEIMDPTTGD
jgi:hypothetical protein